MKRYKFAIALLVLACSMQANTASFTTKRLKGMAEYLSLNGLDTLRTGSYETYSYKGRPLVIRVNKWGEVEHIGLKLFSSGLRELYPSPAYDFLERYLLERNASPTDREEGTKMQWDRVYFSVGSPATALRIDSTAEYNANYYELKVYRVAWSVNGKTVLRMTFDMDYQLMSGCTEIELETNFMRSLSRFETSKINRQQNIRFPEKDTEFIRKGDYFISSFIRDDQYYTKKEGEWELVRSTKRPMHSVANIMLDTNSNDSIHLKVIMDQYGYKKDTLMSTYRQFIQLCAKEGCIPYYGLKDKGNDTYSSTVFLVNRQGGYLHMLNAIIPLSVIDKPEETIIEGRLYTYIPLFNLSAKMLNFQDYQSIK